MLRNAVPAPSAPRASIPRTSPGSRPTSPPPPRSPSSPTARRSAGSHEFERRPHAYPKLWRHHAAQEQADRDHRARGRARGSRGWRATAAASPPSGSSRRRSSCSRRIPRSTPPPSVGSRPPTGSCGSSAASRRATPAPPATRASSRTAATRPGRTCGRSPGLRRLRGGEAGASAVAARRARRRPDREAARWTGLPEGIAVAVGNVDAHVTAPAAQAIEPGHMLAVMGTSTCHVMNGDHLAEVPGMCGVVDGGITPGLFGYEAGQSGVGDIFGWFVERQVPAGYTPRRERRGHQTSHRHLSELAARRQVRAARPGRARLAQRQPLRARRPRAQRRARRRDARHASRGHLPRARSRRPRSEPARSSTRFERGDVPVRELTVAGGLLKNPLVMQIYADVLRRPLHVDRVGRRPCARLGDARGGGGRASRGHRGRIGGDGQGAARRATCPNDGRGGRLRPSCTTHYTTLHDYFGGGPDDARAPPAPTREAALERRQIAAPPAPSSSASSTRSSRSTGSSAGRAGTCRRGCRARS